jgi:hypothetical protein
VDYIYYLGGTLPQSSPNGDISKTALVKRALEIAEQRSLENGDSDIPTIHTAVLRGAAPVAGKPKKPSTAPPPRSEPLPFYELERVQNLPLSDVIKREKSCELYNGILFAMGKLSEFERQPRGRRVRIPSLFVFYDHYDLEQRVSCISSAAADSSRGVSYYEPDDFTDISRMGTEVDSKLLPLQCAIRDTNNKQVKIYPTTNDLEDWSMPSGNAKPGSYLSVWRKGCGRVNLDSDDVSGEYLVNYVFLRNVKTATEYQEYYNRYLMWARDYEAFYVNFVGQFPRLFREFINPPLLPVTALGWCNIENYESEWADWIDHYSKAVPGNPKISASDYVLTVATQPMTNYYTLKHFIKTKLRSLCPSKAEGYMMKNEILAIMHLVLLDLIYRLSIVYDSHNPHTQFIPQIEIDDILVMLDSDNYHVSLSLLPRDYKNLFAKYAPVKSHWAKYSQAIRHSPDLVAWSVATIQNIAKPLNRLIESIY